MSEPSAAFEGPDLAAGIALTELADGAMLTGHAHGEPVLLARRGDEVFAVGTTCTHYGAPLAGGLLVDDTVRCPWHHACFDLRTGAMLRTPALDALPCWRVEQRDGQVYVREKREAPPPRQLAKTAAVPASVTIIGGGAAGNAAAETLRQEGYRGAITILSADAAPPCDRPNLSKGYLAGVMDESTNLLRSLEFYQDKDITLHLNTRVAAIDTVNKQLTLADGSRSAYDALLLATGAEPVQLDLPGADLPHVHYLRTLADSQALAEKAKTSKQAVVIGASFIGLEVTSSLRQRGVEVQVVGREAALMEKVLGPEVGAFLRALHEQHGVIFHLNATATRIDAQQVTLSNGETLPADLVVIGIGVRPATALAEQAGLAMDRGVVVNEYLETSVPGIYAAGDIARWPDPLSGEHVRIEHWVVAERHGQVAARNILGHRECFDQVPFFWTEQYDLGLAYVGHAEHWDSSTIDGTLELDSRNCTIDYRRNGKKLASAVVHRDFEGLLAEREFEQANAAAEEGHMESRRRLS